ncbi:hypothetical protein A5692_18305, partial [Mycobacterium sp. E342]|uniref:DUF732 domain-containing protein n=1 Tax=Mycobacterium sp. E342 TaxID=1834147 RepID=UPI000801EB9E
MLRWRRWRRGRRGRPHRTATAHAATRPAGCAATSAGRSRLWTNQDEIFKALLNQEDIPAIEGVPSLIDTAHKICLVLDRGIPVNTVVSAMLKNAYAKDPAERLYPPARLESTMTRFITASVEAYCPHDQSKIAPILINPAPASNGPTHPAAYLHGAASDPGQQFTGTGAGDLPTTALASAITALPSGDMVPPSPPEIPPPPPPPAHLQTPPSPIAAPIFIVGQPRTGTTILYDLLAQDPGG